MAQIIVKNRGKIKLLGKVRYSRGMKLPRSHTIFGRKYKIRIKRNLTSEEGHPAWGFHDPESRIIFIDPSKDNCTPHTFLHEAFHAVIHTISIDQSLDGKVEEIIVDSLSTYLVENYNICLKNPKRSSKKN